MCDAAPLAAKRSAVRGAMSISVSGSVQPGTALGIVGVFGPQKRKRPRLLQVKDASPNSSPELLAHTIVSSLKLVNGTGEVKSLARAG
jgi:hypothetical protein